MSAELFAARSYLTVGGEHLNLEHGDILLLLGPRSLLPGLGVLLLCGFLHGGRWISLRLSSAGSRRNRTGGVGGKCGDGPSDGDSLVVGGAERHYDVRVIHVLVFHEGFVDSLCHRIDTFR